jgi:hypothetical protein
MSIDLPDTPDADLNSLLSPDLATESGPKPVAHGGGVQAVFNDTDRHRTIYRQFFDLWQYAVGGRDNEPGVVAEIDHTDYDWLGYPDAGQWVLVLKSKGWKSGTGEGDDWSQYYEYNLLLRQQDEDGNLSTKGKSCSLRVTPQLSKPNYKGGKNITYDHGECSLIRHATRWAETRLTPTPSYIYPLSSHLSTMAQTEQEPITFSKKVDKDGRIVVPQEIRQALGIDGREALVEFDAAKVTYLEGGEDE